MINVKLASEGIKVVRVRSLHVMAGEEFSALERAVLIDLQKIRAALRPCIWAAPCLNQRKRRRSSSRPSRQMSKPCAARMRPWCSWARQNMVDADLTFEGTRAVF